MADQTLRFTRGCVATAHHLGATAGAHLLASGGNAVDAAVAANIMLAVVAPHMCGVGGDLVAVVHKDGLHAVTSIGAAPAGAAREAVLDALAAGHGDGDKTPNRAGMPSTGALPVTVPGAVAGWFHLLERFGRCSFSDVAAPALHIAANGFVVSPHAAAHIDRSRQRFPNGPDWLGRFRDMGADRRFTQPELAQTLRTLASEGPAAFYNGHIAQAIVTSLQRRGSTMTTEDFAAHRVTEPALLRGSFRGQTVVELPPPSQGITALTAMAVLDHLGISDNPVDAAHLAIEASRLAYAHREVQLADTAHDGSDLGPAAIPVEELVHQIDPQRAAPPRPAPPLPGGTAYFAAADDDGVAISLSQSNFMGFGSGIYVDEIGIALHNRGAHFTLEPDHPNVIAPGKRPLHTLIPAMILDAAEKPRTIFGTMGGDGQSVIQLQLLSALLDNGDDPRRALDRPRWIIDVGRDVVQYEQRVDPALIDALAQRGHRLEPMAAYDHRAGHAHIIDVLPDGFAAAADPRAESGAAGW